MVVEFKNNYIDSNLKDVYIRQDGKTLKIFFGGNGDLYFDIFGSFNYNEGIRTSSFCINSNTDIYNYFNEFFNDVLNCKIYNNNDLEYFQTCTNIELNRKLKIEDANSKLVKNEVIEWYSDSIYDEKANLLKIEKDNDKIIFTFFDNPDDPVFGFGIRICNFGSKYDPFNICFMNLYNKFQKLAKEEQYKRKTLTI